MSSDWFGCVLVISLYIARVFLELVTKSSSCFTNVLLFSISASCIVHDISRGALEVISDLDGSLGQNLKD